MFHLFLPEFGFFIFFSSFVSFTSLRCCVEPSSLHFMHISQVLNSTYSVSTFIVMYVFVDSFIFLLTLLRFDVAWYWCLQYVNCCYSNITAAYDRLYETIAIPFWLMVWSGWWCIRERYTRHIHISFRYDSNGVKRPIEWQVRQRDLQLPE